MPRGTTRTGGAPSAEEREDPLIDLALARDLFRFMWNACRRHPIVVGVVFAAFLAAGVLGAVLLPRSYYTETKLLTDRNVVMPLLGNPGKPRTEDDRPNRMAYDLIMTRENLLRIARETDLVRESEKHRSLLGKAKRRVRVILNGPITAEQEIDAVLWTLRASMGVQVGEGTVTIGTS